MLADTIATYIHIGLPAAEVAVQQVERGPAPSGETYTVQVTYGAEGAPPFEVVDSDGAPVKNLFPTWRVSMPPEISPESPK